MNKQCVIHRKLINEIFKWHVKSLYVKMSSKIKTKKILAQKGSIHNISVFVQSFYHGVYFSLKKKSCLQED